MKVQEINSGVVYDVYGVSREEEDMPSLGYYGVATRFLIWELTPAGYSWTWVKAENYRPYTEHAPDWGPM